MMSLGYSEISGNAFHGRRRVAITERMDWYEERRLGDVRGRPIPSGVR
jgi:hypothetical protein